MTQPPHETAEGPPPPADYGYPYGGFQAPAPPAPQPKNRTGLIVGGIVGALVLVGGGVTAGILIADDGGDAVGGSGDGQVAKVSGARAAAESFVQAYNQVTAAVSAGSQGEPGDGAIRVTDLTCEQYRGAVGAAMLSGYTAEFSPQLAVQDVAERGDTATVTLRVTTSDGTKSITVNAERTSQPTGHHHGTNPGADDPAGSWMLCDPQFDSLQSGATLPFPGSAQE